jgi:2-polyprenyl-3-methyl-5-hydroxy-6-metoxy-1,4-benzoquinol methylase
MSDFWNQRYAEADYAYGKQPNEYFKSVIDTLPPGRILVPGAGEGRDAVYAATLGWQVTAFDLSTAGQRKAMQLAAEKGVSIRFDITDAAMFAAQPAMYDAVALVFFHLPTAVRVPLYKKLVESLKPGGLLILESFTPQQLHNNSGGPKDADMLSTAAALATELAPLHITENTETVITLNEGPYHQGVSNVVRFLGRR